MSLIQFSGNIHPQLLTLARKYGVDAPDDITPCELNDRLQQTWFKEGYLRYQIEGKPPEGEDVELLQQLGCIKEVRPPREVSVGHYVDDSGETKYASIVYAGVLLLGALHSRVVSRLAYFLEVQPGRLFEPDWKVIMLGGARPLDPLKESPRELLTSTPELPFRKNWHPVNVPPEPITGAKLIKYFLDMWEVLPKTEAGMMEFTWQQSQLPDDWLYELVNTPLQPKPDGGTRPPNTGDTVNEWITKHSSKPGTYLALSNQPFVDYQELVLRRLLPKGFTVYACGPAASPTLPLPTYLDNLAKQLYEELQAQS